MVKVNKSNTTQAWPTPDPWLSGARSPTACVNPDPDPKKPIPPPPPPSAGCAGAGLGVAVHGAADGAAAHADVGRDQGPHRPGDLAPRQPGPRPLSRAHAHAHSASRRSRTSSALSALAVAGIHTHTHASPRARSSTGARTRTDRHPRTLIDREASRLVSLDTCTNTRTRTQRGVPRWGCFL